MNQIEKINAVAKMALNSYRIISKKLKVELHSEDEVERRIEGILNEKNSFLNFSRDLAKKAQSRESQTIQPKEKLSEQKAQITIKNYLGGCYFFTCDEVIIRRNKISLVECKHSKSSLLPSKSDIKDGLVKMMLFANLKKIKINNKQLQHDAVLKLTGRQNCAIDRIRNSQLEFLKLLNKESKENNFKVIWNDKNLSYILC